MLGLVALAVPNGPAIDEALLAAVSGLSALLALVLFLGYTRLPQWAFHAAAVTGTALASAAAFLFSEFADLAVYTPLERSRWLTAVAVSNVVGLIADSALFLWLAFGSLDFLAGQLVF